MEQPLTSRLAIAIAPHAARPQPPDCAWRRAKSLIRLLVGAIRCPSGAVVVEAALCLPPMILLLTGMVSYGSWFMTAHTVQQAADEAARASLAGLTDGERLSLAQSAATAAITAGPGMSAARTRVTGSSDGTYYSVSVTYDATGGLNSIGPVPMPSPIIRRSALIRLSAF